MVGIALAFIIIWCGSIPEPIEGTRALEGRAINDALDIDEPTIDPLGAPIAQTPKPTVIIAAVATANRVVLRI